MGVEIFNRTKYNDEVLKELAEFAHRTCGIEGDVAVVFRYHANSQRFIGLMHHSYPYFNDVTKNLKKFQDKKWMIKRADYNPNAFPQTAHMETAMATKDGAYGYITIRVPRAMKSLSKTSAREVINTALHEMGHIKQVRNPVWSLSDSGCTSWQQFLGYNGKYAAKRTKYMNQPIEIHVRKYLRDLQPVLDESFDYELLIETLVSEFTSEEVIKKAKKQKQSVKYNKYGERMSDYRNVKMKRLRSGDKIVTCPHCGEQAINLHGDLDTFTHIAAVSDEVVRYGGYSPQEARYTQFGHMTYHSGGFAVIEFRYVEPSGEVEEATLKSYNRKGYYG